MAECHPVGFQWVEEAKARGATIIHVDPRFTRTSAIADKHIPIRAGSDVVLLGALINYTLTNDLWFKEYVVAYTNAATLVNDDFRDTEDLGGLFSGFDPETGVLTEEQPLTNGEGETRRETLFTTTFTPRELAMLLEGAGFVLEDLYGCAPGHFSRRPVAAEDVELLAVARRM